MLGATKLTLWHRIDVGL